MKLTREVIAREYAHRVAMNPDACPVCCGDGRTTDRQYGSHVVEQLPHVDVYSFAACAIWHRDHAMVPRDIDVPEEAAATLLRDAEAIVPQVTDDHGTTWSDGGKFWHRVLRALEAGLKAGEHQTVWTTQGVVRVYLDGRLNTEVSA